MRIINLLTFSILLVFSQAYSMHFGDGDDQKEEKINPKKRPREEDPEDKGIKLIRRLPPEQGVVPLTVPPQRAPSFIGTDTINSDTRLCPEGYPSIGNKRRNIEKIDYSGKSFKPCKKTFLDLFPGEEIENIEFHRFFGCLTRGYTSPQVDHLTLELRGIRSFLQLRDMINFDRAAFEDLNIPVFIKQDIVNFILPVLIEAPAFIIETPCFAGYSGKINVFPIRGKHLNKITKVQIFWVCSYGGVELDLNVRLKKTGEIHLIEAICYIPQEIQSGIYKIRFENGRGVDRFFVDRNIYVIDSKNCSMTSGQYYTGDTDINLRTDFCFHGRTHEILFAPDFTRHHPYTYRDANRRDSNGATELVHAVNYKKYDLVNYLLRVGTDPNLPTFAFEYPIMFAAENGSLETVDDLLRYGAFISNVNIDKENALFYAFKSGHNDMVQHLIDKGINTKQLDIYRKNYKGEFVVGKPKILL